MMNCTNHFMERWTERIQEIKDEKEKRDYIAKNREMIVQHANTTFENATFLWKGQIGDNTTKNYYIKDNAIFVTNTTDDALITVYKVDLGFTEELNTTVRRGLVEKIQELQKEKEEIEIESLYEVDSKKSEASSVEDQIKVMEEQLANYRRRKQFLEEEVKFIQNKSLDTGLELKRFTMMLVNSQAHKEDFSKSGR